MREASGASLDVSVSGLPMSSTAAAAAAAAFPGGSCRQTRVVFSGQVIAESTLNVSSGPLLLLQKIPRYPMICYSNPVGVNSGQLDEQTCNSCP